VNVELELEDDEPQPVSDIRAEKIMAEVILTWLFSFVSFWASECGSDATVVVDVANDTQQPRWQALSFFQQPSVAASLPFRSENNILKQL
jgi:hypothetical protein